MLDIFIILLPLFGLIGFGYLIGRSKIADSIVGDYGSDEESNNTAEKIDILNQKEVAPTANKAHPSSLSKETNYKPDYK